MEISEMIPMEKIKPASPTPHHLRIYKISLLDQMMPCMYFPVVLYFPGDGDGSGRIELLKKSLSQTLATFYPFAGVIRDALSADCNDDGLPFSVAKVKGQIRDFLQNPNFDLINKFLPDEYNPERPLGHGDSVMLIQLNCFDCGGIALSILFAHLIADLTSICTFLQCWAANACRDASWSELGSRQATFLALPPSAQGELGFAQFPPLNCIAQSFFPQKPKLPKKLAELHNLMKYMSIGKPVTRRYVFDASALSTLKAELRSNFTGITPSCVEVVTAVIWKCFMAAAVDEPANANFLITQAVDLRRRATPPLPKGSFGNFVWVPAAVCSKQEGKELRELVWELKKVIARIDGEFVRRFEGDDEEFYEYFGELWDEMPQEGSWLAFTSWANMGLYDIDFGWGKPLWLSGIVSYNSESKTIFPNNVVTLMDRRGGDGIEAWVIIDQKYVEGFEKNDEIHKYARINPSVL